VSKARTKKLFQRMMLSYGNAFSRQYPNEKLVDAAIEEWAKQLKPYTDAEIDEAYEQAVREKTWPPNLSEFLQLVKTAHQWPNAISMSCGPYCHARTSNTVEGAADDRHRIRKYQAGTVPDCLSITISPCA